jgi:hypothetical protein
MDISGALAWGLRIRTRLMVGGISRAANFAVNTFAGGFAVRFTGHKTLTGGRVE